MIATVPLFTSASDINPVLSVSSDGNGAAVVSSTHAVPIIAPDNLSNITSSDAVTINSSGRPVHSIL